MLRLISMFILYRACSGRLVLPTSPPCGFNSFEYGRTYLDENMTLGVAQGLSDQLLASGYDTLVIDGGWSQNSTSNASDQNFDDWGVPYPAVGKFPSALDGRGLAALTDQVHALGLKFGVWVIRGIHERAASEKLPVKGTAYTLDELVDHTRGGDQNGSCVWDRPWLGVNTSHPGAQAYYDSVVSTLAGWGVDFIKYDCIGTFNWLPENRAIAEAVRKADRDIVLSLSPGDAGPAARGAAVPEERLASMYRITTDFHGAGRG